MRMRGNIAGKKKKRKKIKFCLQNVSLSVKIAFVCRSGVKGVLFAQAKT